MGEANTGRDPSMARKAGEFKGGNFELVADMPAMGAVNQKFLIDNIMGIYIRGKVILP